MNKFLAVVWILIFGNGAFTFLAGRAAWRLRDAKGKRSELAAAFSIGLYLMSAAFFTILFNSISYPRKDAVPTQSILISSLGWFMFTVGTWVITMSLLNGQPGFVRKFLSRVLRKLR